MDAFVNPNKQTNQNASAPDEEIDYGDGDEDANFLMMLMIMEIREEDRRMKNLRKGTVQLMRRRLILSTSWDAWRRRVSL